MNLRRLAQGLGISSLFIFINVALTLSQQAVIVLDHEKSGVFSVAFSPDGKAVATGAGDGYARLWDVSTGKVLQRFGPVGTVFSLAFSPDGKFLVGGTGEDLLVHVWDVASGREVRTLNGHEGWVHAVAYSSDGKFISSGSADHTLRVWEAQTGKLRYLFEALEKATYFATAFSPDARLVAGGRSDGLIQLWDLATGQQVLQFEAAIGFFSLAFSPDGKLLASGASDGTVHLWDLATGREQRTMNGTHGKTAFSLAYHPNGKLLASGGWDWKVRLWNPATGQQIDQLDGHVDFVLGLSFSPDGKLLASSAYSSDGTVRVWRVKEIIGLISVNSWAGRSSRDVRNPR